MSGLEQLFLGVNIVRIFMEVMIFTRSNPTVGREEMDSYLKKRS